jgi:PAS domain S-box-containing protein
MNTSVMTETDQGYVQASLFEDEQTKKEKKLPNKAAYLTPDHKAPLKLLLVDDEPDFVDLIGYVLKKDGYQTYIANSGEQALKIMKENHIDILITDMRMPGISGVELMQLARHDYPWLQAIAVSAHEKPADAIELMKQGAIDFLQKPISNDDLRLAVQAAADKVRLQFSLKNTTKKLERVIASISDAIWSAELNVRHELLFSFMSPVIENITGRKPEYYYNSYQAHLFCVHREDVKDLQREINALIAGDKTQATCEYRIIHEDSGIRWVQDDISMEEDSNGTLTLNGIISDITRRKQTEAMLIRSESFQKAIVDALPDSILIQDRNGTYESCHAIETSCMYTSPDQLLGKTPWEVYPHRMAHQLEQARVSALQSGEPVSIEYMLPVLGEKKYFENRFVAMGKEHTLAVIRDITARKLVYSALQQSEELYRAIVRNSHDAIFIYDGHTVVFANDNLCDLIGYPQEQVLMMDIRDIIHPEDRHCAMDVSYDCNNRHFSSSYVARILHKTKGVIPCSITTSLTTYRNKCVVLGTMQMM